MDLVRSLEPFVEDEEERKEACLGDNGKKTRRYFYAASDPV